VLIAFTIWNITQILLFLAHSLMISQFAVRSYIHAMYRKVYYFKRAFQTRRITGNKFALHITQFRSLHIVALEETIRFNTHIASPLLFFALTTNTLLNVYLISANFFVDFQLVDRIISITLLIIQAALFLYMFRPLEAIVADLYSCNSFVFEVISILPSKHLLGFKLKCLTHHEMTNAEEKIAFTAGSLGKITNKTVFEVRFKMLQFLQ